MRKSQPAAYPRSREQVTTAQACFFVCMIGLVTVGAAFAQNARVPGTASSYVVDGLALGARVDPDGPAYRGYQCSPSELFPEFTRCQRTQKQQEGSTRRSFEATSSTLHGQDGKAVYINRNIAPWSFDRNEIEDAIKQLSSKFRERAREMRLPPREGVRTAIIAVWGKIQLTELDADAVSILASGESPRKGMLIDFLGNLRRSAQLGLPVYSLSGGAGYIWSAGVDRNSRGHIRFLTVDPSAVSPAAPVSPTTAAQPMPAEIAKTETAEKLNVDAEPAPVEPDPPVEPEKTSVDAAVTKSEVENVAPQEPDKTAPSLARLEKDLGTAEAKIRVLETLAYCALAGLIVFLMIAASLLLAWRKRASAARTRVSETETEPAQRALHVQACRAQSSATNSGLSEKQTAADMTAVSRDAVAGVAAAAEPQSTNEQKHYENKGQTTRKATRRRKGKNVESEQSASATTTSCVHCHREISINDKFCMHCAAAVAVRDAGTRLCSSCPEEIGASDKFCRHCGASSMAVATPSIERTAFGPHQPTKVQNIELGPVFS